MSQLKMLETLNILLPKNKNLLYPKDEILKQS